MSTAVATNRVRPARDGGDNSSPRSTSQGEAASIRVNLDIRVGAMNEWQLSAIKKVLGYRNLAENWDSYGSPTFGNVAIRSAIDFLLAIPYLGLATPRIVPVSGGGVQFDWINGQRELEIEVRPDGSIDILKVENGIPLDDETEELYSRPSIQQMFAWLTES